MFRKFLFFGGLVAAAFQGQQVPIAAAVNNTYNSNSTELVPYGSFNLYKSLDYSINPGYGDFLNENPSTEFLFNSEEFDNNNGDVSTVIDEPTNDVCLNEFFEPFEQECQNHNENTNASVVNEVENNDDQNLQCGLGHHETNETSNSINTTDNENIVGANNSSVQIDRDNQEQENYDKKTNDTTVNVVGNVDDQNPQCGLEQNEATEYSNNTNTINNIINNSNENTDNTDIIDANDSLVRTNDISTNTTNNTNNNSSENTDNKDISDENDSLVQINNNNTGAVYPNNYPWTVPYLAPVAITTLIFSGIYRCFQNPMVKNFAKLTGNLLSSSNLNNALQNNQLTAPAQGQNLLADSPFGQNPSSPNQQNTTEPDKSKDKPGMKIYGDTNEPTKTSTGSDIEITCNSLSDEQVGKIKEGIRIFHESHKISITMSQNGDSFNFLIPKEQKLTKDLKPEEILEQKQKATLQLMLNFFEHTTKDSTCYIKAGDPILMALAQVIAQDAGRNVEITSNNKPTEAQFTKAREIYTELKTKTSLVNKESNESKRIEPAVLSQMFKPGSAPKAPEPVKQETQTQQQSNQTPPMDPMSMFRNMQNMMNPSN